MSHNYESSNHIIQWFKTLGHLGVSWNPDKTRLYQVRPDFSKISLPNSKRIKIESIFTSPVIFNFSICGHVKLENFPSVRKFPQIPKKKFEKISKIFDKMLFLGNLLSSKFNFHEIENLWGWMAVKLEDYLFLRLKYSRFLKILKFLRFKYFTKIFREIISFSVTDFTK